MDRHGVLYSTTNYGGEYSTAGCYQFGCGTVFALKPPTRGHTAWTESTLYAFHGGVDGGLSSAPVTFGYQGALYGTTSIGGTFGLGTAFALAPPQPGQTVWHETVIHSFAGGSDGKYPYSGFTAVGDSLFSTTANGGGYCGFGCGTAYELTPPAPGQTGWTETLIHAFDGFDGAFPGPLLGTASGTFYGTASSGGGGGPGCYYTQGCGTVFTLTPPPLGQTAWTAHVIHYFDGTNGDSPNNVILDSRGSVFGTAYGAGPSGAGLMFELLPPKNGKILWKSSLPYVFSGGAGGGNPYGNMIEGPGGAFYTAAGGGGTCGCGVILKLTR